jgi:hypothetical protein
MGDSIRLTFRIFEVFRIPGDVIITAPGKAPPLSPFDDLPLCGHLYVKALLSGWECPSLLSIYRPILLLSRSEHLRRHQSRPFLASSTSPSAALSVEELSHLAVDAFSFFTNHTSTDPKSSSSPFFKVKPLEATPVGALPRSSRITPSLAILIEELLHLAGDALTTTHCKSPNLPCCAGKIFRGGARRGPFLAPPHLPLCRGFDRGALPSGRRCRHQGARSRTR